MVKTSSELEPSSAASSLNWFLLAALASLSELLIFVRVLLLLQRICSRPASTEVGLAQSQAVYYFIFVNSSKRICAMFIKYFHSFLLEFFYITFAVFPNI